MSGSAYIWLGSLRSAELKEHCEAGHGSGSLLQLFRLKQKLKGTGKLP